MSGRAGVRGPRRTRVYDCNYNMGESYYKPVLDRMDRKYSGKPEMPEPRLRSAFDEPEFRETAADELFDSRGARAPRGRPLSSALEDEEFDDEIAASLKRIRASKKSSRFAEDLDLESSFESRARMSDKMLDSVGLSAPVIQEYRRRAIESDDVEKRSRKIKDEDSSVTRWSAISKTTANSDEESTAAARARATRARLTELEDDMLERSERSAAREQRAARLRALVADSDLDVSTSKLAIRDKKQVSF